MWYITSPDKFELRLQNLTDIENYLDFMSYGYAYNYNYPQLHVGCKVLPGFAPPCFFFLVAYVTDVPNVVTYVVLFLVPCRCRPSYAYIRELQSDVSFANSIHKVRVRYGGRLTSVTFGR